jgi:hypothetical protein
MNLGMLKPTGRFIGAYQYGLLARDGKRLCRPFLFAETPRLMQSQSVSVIGRRAESC